MRIVIDRELAVLMVPVLVSAAVVLWGLKKPWDRLLRRIIYILKQKEGAPCDEGHNSAQVE